MGRRYDLISTLKKTEVGLSVVTSVTIESGMLVRDNKTGLEVICLKMTNADAFPIGAVRVKLNLFRAPDQPEAQEPEAQESAENAEVEAAATSEVVAASETAAEATEDNEVAFDAETSSVAASASDEIESKADDSEPEAAADTKSETAEKVGAKAVEPDDSKVSTDSIAASTEPVPLDEPMYYVYNKIDVGVGETFGEVTLIPMPEGVDIVDFTVAVDEVAFKTGDAPVELPLMPAKKGLNTAGFSEFIEGTSTDVVQHLKPELEKKRKKKAKKHNKKNQLDVFTLERSDAVNDPHNLAGIIVVGLITVVVLAVFIMLAFL